MPIVTSTLTLSTPIEKKSCVPNVIVIWVYKNLWKLDPSNMSAEMMCNYDVQIQRFIALMGTRFHQYSGVSVQDLKQQLDILRKSGKLGRGVKVWRMTRGKKDMIEAYRTEMRIYGINQYGIRLIEGRVIQRLKGER